MAEFQLSYTAEDINNKLGQVDKLGGTVEITSGAPEKENTVLTIDPSAEEVNIYTADEVDELIGNQCGELDEKITQLNTNITNLIGNGNGFGTGVEITSYSENSPYTLPKSGLVFVKSKTSNTNIKAAIGISGIGTIASTIYPLTAGVFLPKGTKVFNRALDGATVSSTPASYSAVTFYPVN